MISGKRETVEGSAFYLFSQCDQTLLQTDNLAVDDDQDDLDLISEVVSHLKITRPVLYCKNGKEFENFLRSKSEAPFFIICEVNLPDVDGFAVKQKKYKKFSLTI